MVAGEQRLVRVMPTGERGSPTPAALADRTRVAMIRLGRQLRRQDPPGPSISWYSALATIAVHGELAIGALAEAERLPSSAATRLADRLEDAGLVERRRHPTDRRGVNLEITPHGREVLDQHRQKGNAWLASRLERLNRSERATLAAALGLLEALVDEDEPDNASPQAIAHPTRRTEAP